MLWPIFLWLLIETCKATDTGCFDKAKSCTKNTCSKFPEFARTNCAKTCGLCGSEYSQSSPCIDKNHDCTAEICRNYPLTAKDLCAKTCGFCKSDSSSIMTSSTYTASSSHHASSNLNSLGKTTGSSTSSKSSSYHSTRLSKEKELECVDLDFDCTKETCNMYPYTSKIKCAKTCGFCSSGATTLLTSLTPSSPSRHSSSGGYSNFGGDAAKGNMGSSRSTHHSTAFEGHSSSGNIGILSKGKEIECVDLNFDCNQQTCKDFPYTAKARCAKTCGFCNKGSVQSTDNRRELNVLDSLTHNKKNDKIELIPDDNLQKKGKSLANDEQCKDSDPHCSQQTCLDRPYTARMKCAKTCGFCEKVDPKGSLIDLRQPSVDIPDEDGTITLDDTRDTTERGSATSHSVHTKNRVTATTKDESRYRSSERLLSSSGNELQSTTKQPSGTKTRFPGRKGPCRDENQYCTSADCYKYPYFSQRYCEKMCGYC
ncbi:unnamed protein product [Thelazia callipaeda]|uniref:ShKT domain-containing protein n=1 Tax=Thelazia callipaeda TaxID=103827 RepID=A0A0N5D0E9_THECL|nr:unnamed protein product [Thelazia callipaeda]